MTKIYSILSIFIVLLVFSACSGKQESQNSSTTAPSSSGKDTPSAGPSDQTPEAPGDRQPPRQEPELSKVDYYRDRYHLLNLDGKLVNNRGDGYEDLYGVRNFRVVLQGVMYRGGANNYYHKEYPRDNRNPLPNDGLMNLCEEGFQSAIYLYRTNFNSAPRVTNCTSQFDEQNSHLSYFQQDPFNATELKESLRMIHAAILDQTKAPIYIHCWNGWHASGLLSAYALRQFCGMGAEEAVAYWDRNTDGNNHDSAYERIRNRIRAFQPYQDLQISSDLKEKICL